MPMRFLIALIPLLVAGACDARGDREKQAAPQAQAVPLGEPDYSHAGSPAPDVTLLRRGEAPLTLTAFRGTPVLVNLWATWCAPCVAELPALDRLAAAKGYDMTVLAVSQDMRGWETIEPFVKKLPLPNLTVLADPDGTLADRLQISGLPVTILYDEAGRELWRVSGPREWDQPGGLPGRPAASAAPDSAADVAYVARGQEPGWIVEITPGESIVVTANYGELNARFPAPATIPPAPFRLERQSDAHAFSLSAAAQACADAMSGAGYPQTVTISIDGEEFRGCGGPPESIEQPG